MPPSAQRPRRSSPVIPPNPLPTPPSRRGSISGHEPRLLVKRNSGDGGRKRDADGEVERRSRNRSGSAPPDNRVRHNHDHHGPQDGQAGLTLVSADESWAWGRNWANVWWSPGGQGQVQMSSHWVQVRGGQIEGRGHREDNDHRGRRSSDAKHPTPTPSPAPRRTSTSSAAEPPVIPGVTTTRGGMGLRNLLRKNPHDSNRKKILFYNKHEPYYCFTNFSPHPVMYRGKRYPTSEHLFQSLKVGSDQ